MIKATYQQYEELNEILKDTYKMLWDVIGNCGICPKSIKLQKKIDILEELKKKMLDGGLIL